MNKRNDISLKGRLLASLGPATTTGLISRVRLAANPLSLLEEFTHGCCIA
jgi:hypothetical protein